MTERGSAPSFEERFLVLAPTGRDAALTCVLLGNAGLLCHACADMAELVRRTEQEGACALLIADEVLVPLALEHLAKMLGQQEAWSDIPILLFAGRGATLQSRPPTAQRLAPLGNVTLLERPVQPITMISAARAAARARRRQYQGREELAAQQRAVRERDHFLAMLGHELRNPLAAITMALEMMSLTDPQGSRYRDIISHHTGSLTRLVDDLLDVSRVTAGKIVLQRADVDIGALIHRCLQSMAAAIGSQRHHVVFTPPSDPLVVDGDQVRLEQVVVNLLANAIKYTPAGGRIELSAARDGDQIVVRVRDSGVGIAPEMIDRVFELFSQVENTLDRAKGGMGIGLTLVRSLVELHGGSIEAASAGLGKGSVFTVHLPRASFATATGRDVLIVENNADSRDKLQRLLESFGHRVDAVADGATAVRHARERRPGIIVVDIGLPDLNGYGVAQQVRESLGSSVYLVALTGCGQPEERQRVLEAGFDVHMTKPVDVAALQHLIVTRANPPTP